MTTARDLIKGALRKINAIGKGAPLDNDEAQDALSVLNQMLASWSAEGGMVFNETSETFNLTSGDGVYTIGVGGDFNTTRPNRIVSAFVTFGGTDTPLIFLTKDQYDSIGIKTDQGEPDCIYYDGNYPLGTIYLDPVPVGGTITLNMVKPMTSFSSLDTVFAMPGEYQMAIEYNLAVLMAPEYETEPSPTVFRMAVRSKKIVMAQNGYADKILSSLDINDGSGVTGNIYSGYWR